MHKARKIFVSFLLITVFFTSHIAAMEVIGNLTSVNYWRTTRFKNVMLSAQQWMPATRVISHEEKWNNGDDSVVLDLDPAHGYPTQLPYQDGYDGVRYWRTITMEATYIESFPFGTFTLLFDGTGDVVLERTMAPDTVTGTGGTTKHEFTLTRNNVKTFSSMANRNPCVRGIAVYIIRSEASDPVRNIRLIIPDANGGTSYVDNFEKQPFREEWLRDLLPFTAIRFMNWVHANSNRDSLWSERVQRGAPFQGTRAPHVYSVNKNNLLINPIREVAYEYMIELCNIIQRDMWINVPCNANDDYIENLAKLIADNLDPKLNCYVEWGNEVWNGSFVGLGYQQALGTELGLANSNYAYTYITGKIENIFKSAFDNPARVRSILAGQKNQPFILKKRVEGLGVAKANPWGFKPYAVSETSYFGTGGITADDKAKYEAFNQEAINAGNVKRIAYEGGCGAGKGDALYGLYNTALSTFEQYFDTFSQFTIFGRWDMNGNWGAKEYVGQPLSEAPKYRALIEYMIDNGQVTQAYINNFDFDANANPINFDDPTNIGIHPTYTVQKSTVMTLSRKGNQIQVALQQGQNKSSLSSLQLFNNRGQVVREISLSAPVNRVSFDISHIAPGTYFLKARGVNEVMPVHLTNSH